MKPEHMKLLRDKRWRLNNLYFITDKQGKKVRFRMTDEQIEYFDGMHTRNIILKARQLTAEQGYQIEEPTHCTEPNGRRTRLNRDTPGFRMRPPPYTPSRTQFADFLVMRGLLVVS